MKKKTGAALFSRILATVLLCTASLSFSIDVAVVKDDGKSLIFTYSLADSLGALPAADATFFYPLTFALPNGARISSLSCTSPQGPVRCEKGAAGLVRSVYAVTLKLYPGATTQGRVTAVYSVPLVKTAASQPVAESRCVEQFYSSFLSNYASASNYRVNPAGLLAKNAGAVFPLAKIKMFVRADGIYAISYDQISRCGFNPSTINPDMFRLFSGGREIPLSIETAIKGSFGPGDRLLFYGEFRRGQTNYYPEQTLGRAYYLDWGTVPGLRVPLVSGAAKVLNRDGTVQFIDPYKFNQSVQTIKKVTRFKRSVHLEEDNVILRLSSPAETHSQASVDPRDYEFKLDDYWMWMDMCHSVNTLAFQLDAGPSPAGKARIRANFMGYSKTPHFLSLRVNGDPIYIEGYSEPDSMQCFWLGQTSKTFVSQNTPEHLKLLQGGANTLTVQLDPNDCVYLNWLEIEYDAEPGMVSSDSTQLIILDSSSLSGAGSYQFSISGMRSVPEIWDIHGRRFTNASVADNTLSFYDIVYGPTTYFVSGRVFSPDHLAAVVPSDLVNSGNGADLLIIAPRSLRPAIASYAAYRRSQGMEVFIADVEAIYDLFGDGSVNPDAIKAFVKYAYEHFNPSPFYLLLIGDTSEGADKLAPERNLVPTYFVQINGWGLASADTRFTTVSGDDLFPDLSVGRIPGRNAQEISQALKKIMDYERYSSPGTWKNDYLLIGGWESIFSTANQRLQDFILKDRFNVRRVDVDTASAYFFGNSSPREVQSIIDNGVMFVNFYGHGGGSVWSDFDPNIMGHTEARALTNYATLPIVYSLTCLTASFEAATFGLPYDLWPPLGETMLLSSKGGCAAFYGASGHSFTESDYLLSFLVAAKSGERKPRVGDIIFDTEQEMLAAYGTDYFPVIGQYNLLGDPAMSIVYPASLEVKLEKSVLARGDSLRIFVSTDSVDVGNGVAQVFNDDGTLSFFKNFSFNGRVDTITVGLKANQDFSAGLIRVTVWDNGRDAMGQARFSVARLTACQLACVADTTGTGKVIMGDTLQFTATLALPESCIIDTVRLLWKADTSYMRRSFTQAAAMAATGPDSAGMAVYATVSGIPLVTGIFDTLRGVSYALAADYTLDHVSRTDTLAYGHERIAGRADISFQNASRVQAVVVDSLVLRTRFRNNGESPARNFLIQQAVNTFPDDTAYYTSRLDSGEVDSVDLPLHANGFLDVRVRLDSRNDIAEKNEVNNTVRAVFGVSGAYFGKRDTVMTGPILGISIRPVNDRDTFRLYGVMDNIDSLAPGYVPIFSSENNYPLSYHQAFYRPRGTLQLERYDFFLASDRNMGDSVIEVRYKAVGKANDSLGFFQWDTSLNFWTWAGGVVDTADSSVRIMTGLNRRIVPGKKRDYTGPSVFASAGGRVLTYKNYIPIQTPIDITIRDESGVDSHTVVVFKSRGDVLSRRLYSMGYAGSVGDVSVSFKPEHEGSDSLYVVAADINGNFSDTAAFAYQLGAELTVKFFANHPNPFGKRTVFAFVITDDADVSIRIYSIAGKLVKTFSQKNIIGYNEIEWDALDQDGRRLSNGVYYLKFTVSNSSTTIEQIHKIAKTEGR
ncbi:MAG: hypothetical protein A2268_05090 [Candidatus Raymondbacteria bacterium RifOxyA12_full_50_37]|nr:MAG: hypothetical protein A2248_10170 [Candidatus Raymondbacteria bacterium RIFOXYA2_FULL_49_16]OGJ88142.1 MAG: hypothetical protein A2268_05090 [Candidatus Raymondbacteria bacterium RifOxyA12_full_50_37]OGJ96944.1 MAG: hypothetical protein A2453_04895 [Candidatus Raymondbacteria bacterium RIFOXYC2_FULL_50_21]OGK06208.1 MAG: hypothetical protein A2487_04715 [Candidatus Raymondbacteria bacterium RifOxyC12_full_50_8]OGP41866.1 MAG: hypothetical protein A2324_18665 [Candidatus Raymondbacteria b